jgi:hypothetical protein
MEFLEVLNDQGDIKPELLTADKNLQSTIGAHPGLNWKALNVREHRRRQAGNEPDFTP